MGIKAISKLAYFFSIIISLFFVGITIAGTYSSKADPNDHPLLGYIGVILPALLIINLLYIVYWGIRRKWWILFPIIAIAFNYEFITAMFQYSKTVEHQGNTLKIATYNVHAFNAQSTGYDAKQIAKFMEKEKIDILCFQEFSGNKHFNIDRICSTFHEYSYKYIPRINHETRIAIFSKYPIIDSLAIPFSQSSNCGMWTDIKIDNRIVRLFNVHMQTTSLNQSKKFLAKEMQIENSYGQKEAIENLNKKIVNNQKLRAQQAILIKEHIEGTKHPVILCGDFNDTPASYTYHTLKGNLSDGFKTCGNGYGYTFRGLHQLLRIDYLFYSKELKGIKYYSPSLKWSDHNPVIMELSVE